MKTYIFVLPSDEEIKTDISNRSTWEKILENHEKLSKEIFLHPESEFYELQQFIRDFNSEYISDQCFIAALEVDENLLKHCKGYKHSDCCDSDIDEESMFCLSCKEHCENLCYECNFQRICENYKKL